VTIQSPVAQTPTNVRKSAVKKDGSQGDFEPIATRTRHMIARLKKSPPLTRSPRKDQQNGTIPSTSAAPTVQSPPKPKEDAKSVLVSRMKSVLNGELFADELDGHPLLQGENASGFKHLLNQVANH
jgi:hypothetical protein